MNKKLLAVAVAGAVATPMLAGAQTSGLSVYGRIGNELQRETQDFTAPWRDTGTTEVMGVVEVTSSGALERWYISEDPRAGLARLSVTPAGGGNAVNSGRSGNVPALGSFTKETTYDLGVPTVGDPAGGVNTYIGVINDAGNLVQVPNRVATAADLENYTGTNAELRRVAAAALGEQFVSTEDSQSTEVDTYSSRLGLRYNGSVGGGLTVHGQYEFDVVSDRENSADGDAINDVRVATVGVSGDFGRIDIGNLWSAYYNKIGGNLDTMDMIYSTIGQGPGRTSNTIQYSNAFGAVDLMVDLRLLGDESRLETEGNTDGFGVGVSFTPIANFSVSLGYDREDQADGSEVSRSGIAGSYNFSGITVRGGWQELSTEGANVATSDATSYYVSASGAIDANTSWILGYAEGEALQSDTSTARDPNSDELIFRLARQLGGGLAIGYEASFQTAGGVTRSATIRNGEVISTTFESGYVRQATDIDIAYSNAYELTRHNVYMQLDF